MIDDKNALDNNENKLNDIAEDMSPEPNADESKVKNKKKKSKGISQTELIISLALAVVITFMTTYSLMYVQVKQAINEVKIDYSQKKLYDADTQEKLYDADTIEQIKTLYETYYVGELGDFDPDSYLLFNMSDFENWDSASVTAALAQIYVARTGDKYGEYYTTDEYDEVMNGFRGETVGIGVYVTYDSFKKQIEVLSVFDGSPAEKAGITAGDRITSVDGISLQELTYDEAVDKIKGEEGTELTVTAMRDGKEMRFTMTRAAATATSVYQRISDDGVTGVIRLIQFTEATPEQFKNAIEAVTNAGAKQLVFDVRDNPGGLLSSVLSVVSYVLPEGTGIIREVDKSGKEEVTYCEDEHTIDLPYVVLTNSDTASAAELFTIDLRDHGGAETVGTKTYGKGVEQTFFNLPLNAVLKMTYKWYSSTVSDNFDGKGIEPTVYVEPAEGFENVNLFKLADKDDAQLQKAIEVLNSKTN